MMSDVTSLIQRSPTRQSLVPQASALDDYLGELLLDGAASGLSEPAGPRLVLVECAGLRLALPLTRVVRVLAAPPLPSTPLLSTSLERPSEPGQSWLIGQYSDESGVRPVADLAHWLLLQESRPCPDSPPPAVWVVLRDAPCVLACDQLLGDMALPVNLHLRSKQTRRRWLLATSFQPPCALLDVDELARQMLLVQ